MPQPLWSTKDSVILIFVVPMVKEMTVVMTFLVCFEDICGYHCNQVTIRTNCDLSSDITLKVY